MKSIEVMGSVEAKFRARNIRPECSVLDASGLGTGSSCDIIASVLTVAMADSMSLISQQAILGRIIPFCVTIPAIDNSARAVYYTIKSFIIS
jgi:hypothetical protein